MKSKIFILLLAICFALSCEEEERGQYPLDTIPPRQIVNPQVENIAGGAIISYTIPDDDDLLYVKVIYQLDNGTVMEQKASAYTNRIQVEGLGKSKAQTVSLVCGDRSKNESEPVEVEIHPMEAPIFEILESVNIENDFGGVFITWENPAKADVVLTVATWNEEDAKYEEVENFYTNSGTGKGNIRGLPAEEIIFAVYLRDKWGNNTDTISGTYLPLFEEALDKARFARWNPPGISYTNYSNWYIENMWDEKGALISPGFMGSTAVTLPTSFTFDMGQVAKLSRLKLYQRCNASQTYTAGNLRHFKLYGSDHPGVTDDPSTWVFLGEFESYKPSGLPIGQITDEDQAFAVAGEDFNMAIGSPAVRYLRFDVLKTWGGANNFVIMELDAFGNIVN